MSVGKAAAQATHAAIRSAIQINSPTYLAKWIAGPHQTVIVLEARDAEHMDNIKSYLAERDIPTTTYIDEGVNEIDPHTPTAMATRILDKDSEYVSKAFSSFELYKDVIEVIHRYEK